eukprot:gene5775-1028_t
MLALPTLAALGVFAEASGDTTNCKNGPGNDECTTAQPRYVYHLNDFTCSINDPNGPWNPLPEQADGPSLAQPSSRHFMMWGTCPTEWALTRCRTPTIPASPSRCWDACSPYSPPLQTTLRSPREGSGPDQTGATGLPVAIWNDKWYDNRAIFSGAALHPKLGLRHAGTPAKPLFFTPGPRRSWTAVRSSSIPPPYPTFPGYLPPIMNAAYGCSQSQFRFTYDVAVPANESDPLYTEWTKPSPGPHTLAFMGPWLHHPVYSYNPIVNGTGDDPSTAWKTPHGEWRIIGNQGGGQGAPTYGSMDFVTWYKVGYTELRLGDCPTFFPLPKLTPGTANPGKLPNWVHKAGSGNDQIQVGTWEDGLPGRQGTPGTWTQWPGTTSVPVDNGQTHASKVLQCPGSNQAAIPLAQMAFPDPDSRLHSLTPIPRISGTPSPAGGSCGYGALFRGGIQTVPRELTYHPDLMRIIQTPVAELEQLRNGTLDTKSTTPLTPGSPVTVKATAAADVIVVFAVPKVKTTLAVNLGNGAVPVYVDYTPPTGPGPYAVPVGIGRAPPPAPPGPAPGPYMVDTDIGGGDYNVTNVQYTDPHLCQAACYDDPHCKAWTYVVRPPTKGACCLKDHVGKPTVNPTCTSGVANQAPSERGPGAGLGPMETGGTMVQGAPSDTLMMLPSDQTIEVRVLLDTQ